MALSQKLQLSTHEIELLQKLTRIHTIEARILQHAKILLLKADGLSSTNIAAKLDLNIKSVFLCLNKYRAGGLENALYALPRTGRKSDISDADRTFVINAACKRPKDVGYAAEVWTYSLLTAYIRALANEQHITRLTNISRSAVAGILQKSNIKPFKIKYYLEKRDAQFDEKMHNILVVYKQIELNFDGDNQVQSADISKINYVSYDEKPGIQAISCTAPDKTPTQEHGFISRDSEYIRHGTVSLLAGIDLLTGEAMPLVSDTHKSSDFIAFLRMVDTKYPEGEKIRLILDNHSVHRSKETMAFLATKPLRFEFVFTPKHGSWLNLIESFFSKMTKQMLRGIRVASKDELIRRIYMYFNEVNEDPIVFHWKYRLDEINEDESPVIDISS